MSIPEARGVITTNNLPVSTVDGGLRPGVRLESNGELEDVMDGLRSHPPLDDATTRENPP